MSNASEEIAAAIDAVETAWQTFGWEDTNDHERRAREASTALRAAIDNALTIRVDLDDLRAEIVGYKKRIESLSAAYAIQRDLIASQQNRLFRRVRVTNNE
jgi:hypothetical protein